MTVEKTRGGRKDEPMETETEQELTPQEYEHLLAQYEDSFKNLQEGQIIRGRVLAVTPSEVIVDIGYKSEGIIPATEFTDFSGNVTVKEGDHVDVLLERTEDQNGYVVLSKDKAEKMKVWDEVEKSYRLGTTVRGRVIDRIKGGLAVDIGVKAFLPGSLVDVKPVKNLEALRGRELDFKVISVDKKRGNIVLSRKAVVEIEQEAKKKETLQLLEEGRVLRGVVKNLTDYGAFVDLGGLDGLLHVTDMSWGRVNHPSDLVKVGDEIDVVVLKFDRETERVSLGTKQLTEDPWAHVPDRYPPGSRVAGRVTNVTDYGAFVELEEGVEGLVHVSEMSWSKKVKSPSKVVSPGDQVEAIVTDVNRDARRISLSLKDTLPDPWDSVVEKYAVGSTVQGKVRNLTDFGAFVEIEEGVDGLVHVSDMSWTKRIKHPSEVLKKGDDVQALITSIDQENRRISLSIKEFQPNDWQTFKDRHQVGDVVDGVVTRVADFGVFVQIETLVEGLMHVSETTLARGAKPQEHFHEGDPVRARILRIDDAEMKVGLSGLNVEAAAPPTEAAAETAPASAEAMAGKPAPSDSSSAASANGEALSGKPVSAESIAEQPAEPPARVAAPSSEATAKRKPPAKADAAAEPAPKKKRTRKKTEDAPAKAK
jgi:small subunit ribosomal protein S1